MASIFNSLKDLITPELISKAASALGENESGVVKASTALVPSLLGSLLAKGNDKHVETALKEAGNANDSILSDITNIFSGKSGEHAQGVSSNLLSSILGDKVGGLASMISSFSGISSQSSHGLLSMITPMLGGFLGNKMSTDGLNLSGLLGLLGKEKGSFMDMIPSGLTSVLGISSLAHLGSNLVENGGKVVDDAKNAAGSVMNGSPKKGMGTKWLLILAACILLGLLMWRSCKNKAVKTANTAIEETMVVKDKVEEEVKSLTDISLPDGVKLQVHSGGIEDKITSFLKSDEYKNATPEQLKEKWFNFNNINFEFGSSTKLTPESYTEIDNVISILKNYKDAKIKIGAYTDKKGDAEENMKISNERAATIKNIFTEKGLGSQITGAEGYGDKFATVSADATDEERAIDRKIALRFEK